MRRTISGKRVIVTGASSGIGRELAMQLVARGAKVVGTARREGRLQAMLAEFQSMPRDPEASSGELVVVAGDITQPEVRANVIDTCRRQFGGLDILINNAGIGAMGRFDQADGDRMRKVFSVNLFAVADLIREALPDLKAGVQPVIVNMSSVLAHRAAPLKSEYCASKFALHGFSDSIRAELVGDGVDLLLVSPSTTDSEFFDHAIDDPTGKNWKKRGAMPPAVVARKTIRAIETGKHEIILTHGGRLLVWLDRLIPGVANRLMAKFGQ